MGTQRGRYRRALIMPRSYCTFNVPSVNAVEVLVDEVVPTSEPANGQIDYTVTANDVVTKDGMCYDFAHIARACIVIYNGMATNKTINWRWRIAGVNQNSGTATANNGQYATMNFAGRVTQALPAPVGSRFELKVWCTTADANLRIKFKAVPPFTMSRICPARGYSILTEVNVTSTVIVPTYTLGNPSVLNTYGWRQIYSEQNVASSTTTDFIGAFTMGRCCAPTTGTRPALSCQGIGFPYDTDSTNGYVMTTYNSATLYPRYNKNHIPTAMNFVHIPFRRDEVLA